MGVGVTLGVTKVKLGVTENMGVMATEREDDIEGLGDIISDWGVALLGVSATVCGVVLLGVGAMDWGAVLLGNTDGLDEELLEDGDTEAGEGIKELGVGATLPGVDDIV